MGWEYSWDERPYGGDCEFYVKWLNDKAAEGWELVTHAGGLQHIFRRRTEQQSPELKAAYKKLNEAQELVVQAFNEWTPTQSPDDKWLRRAKAIKESREY